MLPKILLHLAGGNFSAELPFLEVFTPWGLFMRQLAQFPRRELAINVEHFVEQSLLFATENIGIEITWRRNGTDRKSVV